MSYFGFHALFIAPVIAVLILAQGRPMGGVGARHAWKWIGTLALIAFVYTTAWDNYLVFRGVWGYGADRVLATIGYVPVEEYLFFLLQPVLTGLWYMVVRTRRYEVSTDSPPSIRFTLVSFWLVTTLAGGLLLTGGSTLYLGLILVWVGPVLAGMAWLSAETFWRHRTEWMVSIAVPTVYLWIADRIAIGAGIWYISDSYSLNFDPLGLPIEEALFFLVTNMMVVQGLMMFLPDERLHIAITEN